MGKYSHRRVSELKAFIKKYNDHFEIKVTGKSKDQLIESIDAGMKKEVTQELKDAHRDLVAKGGKIPRKYKDDLTKPDDRVSKAKPKMTPKEPEKKKKVIKKIKIGNKKEMKKEDEVREIEDVPKKKVEAIRVVKGKRRSYDLEATDKKEPLLKLKLKEEQRKIGRRRAFLGKTQMKPKL